MRVLVTYASRHESTAEIAEKIGDVLVNSGFSVEVSEINDLDDINKYQAIIVGSSVYFGDWLKEMVHFLHDHLEALIEKDVWIFSSGPTGQKDEFEILAEWRFPEKHRGLLEKIRPHEGVVFFGNLDPERLNIIERGLIKIKKAPVGDYRDWDEISEWAVSIANQLEAD